jgi:hypothetical protein
LEKRYIQIARFIKGLQYFIRGLSEFSAATFEDEELEWHPVKTQEGI